MAISKQKRQIYEFDNFRLDSQERQLLRDGQPVQLPSKAFDLLLTLVENSGRLVDKEELYQRVWADQTVEESNLTVQMSAIRKALGERKENPRYIVTVSGRGYRFIGEVASLGEDCEAAIEAGALSHVVIEKERHSDSHLIDDGLETVKAVPAVGSRRRLTQRVGSPTWRFALGMIAATLAVGLGVLIYYQASAERAAPNQIKSIAVLPFKPLTIDNRDESLEMGMADTLISKLSNIKEINVRPISAVRGYVALEQDALAAGREQKVDAVVDGQIQKSGERIRVTVRLMRTGNGATLWTDQFDEKMTDIFRVQDSISERVTGVLALKLTGEEKERLGRRYTENTEAHQLYLMGRYHLNRLTDEGFLKSLEYFQQAIEKDSSFALAHVGVAESYNALGGFNVTRPKEVYPKARSAAETALKLDDLLAQAHTALAMVKLAYDWDWSGAESEFKRAIELNPSDSDARRQYGFHLTFMGQFDEAVAQVRRARELDPASPVIITETGQALYMARRYDEAIEECRKALEMDPNFGFAHWVLGLAYMEKRIYEQATRAFQNAIPLSGDSPDETASLGHAYALSGKRVEALKILRELKLQSKRKYISPTVIAMLCGALGEKDQAFKWLDKAYDERDSMLVVIRVEPLFEPLRSDARFTDLLRRVGLQQ
jgi:DNA-binding winged helix-turn-helix (wHTH) protein/TolB-like protein/tetratricopeptide (TPR) repeat protein